MEVSIIRIVLSRVTAIVVEIVALLRNLKIAKFCCCKSECQRSEEEIEAQERVDVIRCIEEEHLKTVQSLYDIIQNSHTPVLVVENQKNNETVL